MKTEIAAKIRLKALFACCLVLHGAFVFAIEPVMIEIEQSPIQLMTDAEKAFQSKDFAVAERLLQRLLKTNENNVEALYWLSLVNANQGKKIDALSILQHVVQLAPLHRQARLDFSALLVELEKWGDAVSQYEYLVSQSESQEVKLEAKKQLYQIKGQVLINEKKYEQALSHYQSMSALFPRDVLSLEALGYVYAQVQMWEESEKYFLKAQEIAPDQASVRLRLGKMYVNARNTTAARAAFKKTIEIDAQGTFGREAAKHLIDMAQANIEEKDFSGARAALDDLLQVSPNHVDGNIMLADLFAKTNQHERGEKIYDSLLEAYRNNIDITFRLAGLYAKLNASDKAINLYLGIGEIAPGSQIAHESNTKLIELQTKIADQLTSVDADADNRDQAIVILKNWIATGRLDSAQWLSDRLLARHSNDTETHFRAAQVREKLGEIDKALEHYARAVWIDSSRMDIRFAYGNAFVLKGDLSAAEAVYRDVISLSNDDVIKKTADISLRFVIGVRLLREGKQAQAIAQYRETQQAYPRDLEVIARLSNVYASLNLFADAEMMSAKAEEIRLVIGKVTEYVAQGRQFLDKGDVNRAREKFLEVLDYDKKNAEANYWLGMIESRNGNANIAVTYLKKAVDAAPQNMTLRIQYAQHLVHSRDLVEAIKQFREILATVSVKQDKKEVLRQLRYAEGLKMMDAKNYDLALNIFQSMQLNYPNDIDVLNALASLYIELNFIDEAQQSYARILDVDPSNTLAYVKLAALAERTGNYSKQREFLAKIIMIDNTGRYAEFAESTLLNSSRVHVEKRDLEQAELDINAILSVRPAHIGANVALAFLYEQQNKLIDAENTYTRLLALKPAMIEVRRKLADLYFAQNDYSKALAEFEKIYDMSPNTDAGHTANAKLNYLYGKQAENLSKRLNSRESISKAIQVAETWLSRKRFDPAQWLLTSVTDASPDSDKAFNLLGELYVSRGDYVAAQNYFQQSIRLQPTHARYVYNYANTLLNLGSIDQAEAAFNTAAVLSGTDADLKRDAEFQLAMIAGDRYLMREEYEDALDFFRKLQLRYVRDVSIIGKIGGTLVNLNRLDEAEEVYRSALSIRPNDVTINVALAQLYRQQGKSKAYLKQLRQTFLLDPSGGLNEKMLAELGLKEGLDQLHKGRRDAARVAFQRALETNPNNIFAQIGISAIYLDSGNMDLADMALNKVTSLEDSNLETRLRFLMLKTSYANQ